MQLTSTQILTLGSPAVSILFSIGFVLVWIYGRRRHHYLLYISASFFTYAAAATSQILHVPADYGVNALVSGGLFMCSLILLVRGVAQRYRAPFDPAIYILQFIATLGALAYFYYVERDLISRIYILNFSVAGMALLSVFRIRSACRGALIDRTFFWVYLLFGLSFFPRTILSASKTVTGDVPAFVASPFWLALQLSLLLFAVMLALVLLAAAMLEIISALEHERNIDGLTQLHNRRSFEERSLREISHLRNEPISLVLCDIDHFKTINDYYGHLAGDMVLVECGALLRQCIRTHDIAGRLGGEEFVVLMPNTNLQGAQAWADRVRTILAKTRFPSLPDHHSITASFGVATRLPNESLEDLIRRADVMLYAAKDDGRNRVVVDEQDAERMPLSEELNNIASAS